MLDGLLVRIAAAATTPPSVITVPSVHSAKKLREPLQATHDQAAPRVPSVHPEKTNFKTKSEIIASIKQEQPADDTYDSLDDRHYCHKCANLIRQRCIVQKFRPVDDIPRRCTDLSMPLMSIAIYRIKK